MKKKNQIEEAEKQTILKFLMSTTFVFLSEIFTIRSGTFDC